VKNGLIIHFGTHTCYPRSYSAEWYIIWLKFDIDSIENLQINKGVPIYGTFPRPPMGYGIWERLVHLAGNRLGGHMKVWLMGGYGLSQVWVKTEATVAQNSALDVEVATRTLLSRTLRDIN
jgi:hypothetical protein